MKRLMALIICLCLLLGLPLSVQAVEPTEGMTLTAVALPISSSITVDNRSIPLSGDNTVVLYASKAPKNNFNNNGTIVCYDENDDVIARLTTNQIGNIYGGNTTVDKTVNGYSQVSRYNAFWINDTDNAYTSFPAAKKAGAVRFEFWLRDNPSTRDGSLNGQQAIVDNSYVTATAVVDGYDGVKLPIIMSNDYLKVENATKVDEQTILVKFTEPIATTGLYKDGGSLDIWFRVVDSNNRLVQYSKEGGGNANAQWQVTAATVCAGHEEYMQLTIPKLAEGEAKFQELKQEHPEYELVVHMADFRDITGANVELSHNNWLNFDQSGNNVMVDGIWSLTTNCRLHATKSKADYLIIEYTSDDKVVALANNKAFSSLKDALNEVATAEDGKRVTLFDDVETTDMVTMVSAGVTLNLNGKKVTAKNLISFGNIIDSTEGDGGIIISQDETKSGIYLQEGNKALPLYDDSLNGYRFFTYSVTSVGTRNTKQDANPNNDGDLSWVQFGIKVRFDVQKAYDLLADDVNQDVALIFELNAGANNFLIQIKQSTLQKLANDVKDNFSGRAGKAIVLTVSGLDSLDKGTVLKTTATLYSARNVLMRSEEMAYITPGTGLEVA